MSGANGPPLFTVSTNGVGVTSDAQLNTYVQGCALLSGLRGFTPLSNMTAYMIGMNTPGDGWAGAFYWNSTSTATDDNGETTVQPYGQTTGRWLRIGSQNAAQIPGTTTNDNANPGNLGEYQVNVTGPVSLTTATAANITTLTLTPGDWDVAGLITFAAAGSTTITLLGAYATLTSASLSNPLSYTGIATTFTTGTSNAFNTGVARLSIAVTTTVYLVGYAVFGTSTMTAFGTLRARRAR